MTLDECRRFYAEEIQLFAGITSPAMVEAFARVPRENFLGPGPWQMGIAGYVTTADADPRRVYHNVPVAIDAGRGLNNGQPGALAAWIQALDLKSGDCVFHLGCGVGYYTAIMAEMVGAEGTIAASEVDRELASRARENLAGYTNVMVHAGDGAELDRGPYDAIFINAGVTHPHPKWLEQLCEGGRLVLPLTVSTRAIPSLAAASTTSAAMRVSGAGVMAKIVHERSGFSAGVFSQVAIYPCASVRDPELEPLLLKAMGTGMLAKMRSVLRDTHQQADTCVLHGRDICLSTTEVVAG